MSYEKLRDEIKLDPLGRGYAGMIVDQVVTSLNAKDRVVQGPVPAKQILRWSAATDGINSLKTAAASGNKDKRRRAEAALAMLNSPHVPDMEVADAEIDDMLSACVALGIFTAADVTALKARGQVTLSRAEELGIGVVTRGQVLRYKQE